MKRKYYIALIAPHGKSIASGAELISEFDNLEEARATADECRVEDEAIRNTRRNTSENKWGVVDGAKKVIYVSF
jgi:hypothetical protein